MAKYTQPEENEWVQPIRKGYKMACCDCGLIHNLDFRIVGKKRKTIQFKASRNCRATAAMRRGDNSPVRKIRGLLENIAFDDCSISNELTRKTNVDCAKKALLLLKKIGNCPVFLKS